MKREILTLALAFGALVASAQTTEKINIEDGERWWGAATGLGLSMPYGGGNKAEIDQRKYNLNNQTSPLLISSKGRSLWCSGPFKMKAEGKQINLTSDKGSFELQTYGKTLRDAYCGVMQKHFPPTGSVPPELFFTRPTYNTWIELVYNQNQADVMKYAKGIVDNGFPTGVLMIDDNWQQDYGVWEFRAEQFPNPKAMVDSLHDMGFKVMLWVCPFVSPDSKKGRDLAKKGYFLKRKGTDEPAVVAWWNGYSHVYDLSNPEARAYLKHEFADLQQRYGIDGFKLDAGDQC